MPVDAVPPTPIPSPAAAAASPLPADSPTPAPTRTPIPTHTPVPTRTVTPTRTPDPNVTGTPAAQGRFVTSSHSRKYYYCADDPAWHTLAATNLAWFDTEDALHAQYPNLVLHAPCKP